MLTKRPYQNACHHPKSFKNKILRFVRLSRYLPGETRRACKMVEAVGIEPASEAGRREVNEELETIDDRLKEKEKV